MRWAREGQGWTRDLPLGTLSGEGGTLALGGVHVRYGRWSSSAIHRPSGVPPLVFQIFDCPTNERSFLPSAAMICHGFTIQP